MKNIAIIGCGARVSYLIKLIIEDYQYKDSLKLKAICDINVEKVKKNLDTYNVDYSEVEFFTDADEMLDNNELSGVMIGTRCDLHTFFAEKVIKRGIPLFLEKPIATTREDLKKLYKLRQKYPEMNEKTVVSFPLRTTVLLEKAKEIVNSGKIGKIQDIQAYNNVSYGRVYYKSWYRDDNITQGLFLQKATHDFDYINYLVADLKPTMVCAMESKQVFKGDKPAGLSCSDCDERYTCLESSILIRNVFSDEPYGDGCSYAVDTGNEDSSSAIIRYENGMHMTYSQNFFVRKGGGERGAKIFGENGTMNFSWDKNKIDVFLHFEPIVETYDFTGVSGGHGGGDNMLARNFAKMLCENEKSKTTLDSGLLSVLMCICAKESSMSNQFIPTNWDWID
jgi:predicted dehydrogenase